MESTIDKELEMLKACKTEEERQVLIKKITETHKNEDSDTIMNKLMDIKKKVSDLSLEVRLLEIQKYGVSLTHIAKSYLGKSRPYLSQRLHGNNVNGKKQSLTQDDIRKIANGLSNTSIKLQELSASLLSV